MAWLGKFQNLSSNLGNLSDLAGAVSKLSESVKNIERNFDSALGFDDRSNDVPSPSETRVQPVELPASPAKHPKVASENENVQGVSSPEIAVKHQADKPNVDVPEKIEPPAIQHVQEEPVSTKAEEKSGTEESGESVQVPGADINSELSEKVISQSGDKSNVATDSRQSEGEPVVSEQLLDSLPEGNADDVKSISSNIEIIDVRPKEQKEVTSTSEKKNSVGQTDAVDSLQSADSTNRGARETSKDVEETRFTVTSPAVAKVDSANSAGSKKLDIFPDERSESTNHVIESKEEVSKAGEALVDGTMVSEKSNVEENKLKAELKMMEAALQGAAKQAQMKADEISRLMGENEKLKADVDAYKNKSNDMELDALREEFQQRIGAAERKVYALTKERDMLRREQSRKNDSSILLKEKDEIIKQVMAEGEELSKKQAVQEGIMKKLRAQVEEGKVESMRKDKVMTEKALQDAVERGQTELAAVREYYTNALNEAKDAEAQAEARADSEAKADLERRCRESADRETALLQSLDELRQALSATEQQAAYREDMLRRDLEDLERRCQAAEARYDELLANMPDSTRPLLRQIEGLEEAAAMRAEVWAGVERSLNSRLQEAEAKAAGAQERERAINERLSQTLSRMAVMEAQLSCLRAEQSQLTRSLEKERQRASESRQEFLVATERAATHEGRAKQLEEAIESLRARHKQDLKEERTRRLALEQEVEQERAVTAEYEKRLRADGRTGADKTPEKSTPNSNMLTMSQTEFSSTVKNHKRMPSVSSAGSMEESFFLQASVDTGPSVERLSFSERPPSPYTRGMGMTLGLGTSSLEQLEGQLRQKEGELSSCFARLAALESTRDSLAEELVKATTQNEMYRSEANLLPGLRAELDSLRRRHTSALELMGERDEEVEELKADLADVKQMYREQITMLVGQIERLSVAIGSR
ncbi:hypothetical protein AXG93_3017s1040 [Marchantia polymorpha subsp. ruderalis]|uniref:TATA element modulatory factor 1 TATA binding domain-containing protein n=1 Tax=Marchantia polymorpha subsp. ruderalis TaxID=1480154 RepID=A0A176WHG9_MARPO|nr:hypothetical protein AXG93_3017s1040 [Marchantia polymorpha subsp. ruderalis]